MRLSLTVVTKSSRNAVAGWVGDSVKVCVTAVPERGKANAAVTNTLARALGVSRDQLRIVSGKESRRKIVDVGGVDEREVKERLAGLAPRASVLSLSTQGNDRRDAGRGVPVRL
jgi:uncharacterized protein (TIGR00251 family)